MSICDWSGMGDYGVCVTMRMIASKRNGRRGRGSGRTMWCRTKVSYFPPVRGGNCRCDRKKDEAVPWSWTALGTRLQLEGASENGQVMGCSSRSVLDAYVRASRCR